MQNTVMACGLRERGKELWDQVCKGRSRNDESGAIGERSQHDTQMALLFLKQSNYKLTSGRQICFGTMCIYRKKKKWNEKLLKLHYQLLQVEEFHDARTPKIKQELQLC